MDNEREVALVASAAQADLIERSKTIFLRELINEFRRQQLQYDLPTEFAKTKRNQSLFVPVTILVLIAVFGLVMVLLTNFIQRNSRDIAINIQDFADVNLRDILDAAQRLQNQLAGAERELRETVDERDERIGQLERENARAVQLLQEGGLGAAQRQQQTAALNARVAQDIAAVETEFAPRIALLQTRIAELQDQIAEYDSRQLAQAREQEAVLNNQQRVFEIQTETLRSEYENRIAQLTQRAEAEIRALEQYQQEFDRTIRRRHADELATLRAAHAAEVARLTARFNPDLSSDSVGPLLSRLLPAQVAAYRGPGNFDLLLAREGVISATDYQRLVADYQEWARVMTRLREVPYLNSVPPALEQLDLRARDLLSRQEVLWRSLGATVVQRDSVIAARDATIAALEQRVARHQFALDELSRFNGEAGYIVDPRNTGEIVVYLNPLQRVEAGTLGFVFRRDDQYVGTIRFIGGGDDPRARVEHLEDQLELRAFDKVLVQTR